MKQTIAIAAFFLDFAFHFVDDVNELRQRQKRNRHVTRLLSAWYSKASFVERSVKE
jgi:hypothetical protein